MYADDAAKNSRSFLQHGREGKTGQHDGDEDGQTAPGEKTKI